MIWTHFRDKYLGMSMNSNNADIGPSLTSNGLRPLSFRDWKAAFGADGGLATYDRYQSYVQRWTEDRVAEQTEADKVRSDYIDMLKSIYVYLDEDTRRLFDRDVDWNSQLDLARVVPLFARKIRDIIRYFADKRESVIRSKLKYNMHGTFLSLERMLHEYLLSNYTKRRHYENGVSPVDGKLLPDLYDVNTKLSTRVREYYDAENYFDKSPHVAVSAYYPGMYGLSGSEFATSAAASVYGEWDFGDVDETNWLFGGGYTGGRKIDNPMYEAVISAVLGTSGLSGEELEAAENEYVFEMTKKYLGNNIVVVSGGNYYPPKVTCRYDFSEGNNWFYFPSGVVQSDAGIEEVPPISIHDTTLAEVGTGGGSYGTADRIFVRTPNGVKGAWLKQPKYTHSLSSIDGVFPGGTPTQFRFPFLGYGISAEGMEWSGPTLTNRNPKYEMLSEAEKVAVQKRYWGAEKPDFNCDSLNIQELGLSEADGASGASSFQYADHFSVRSGTEDAGATVYDEGVGQYWLFRPVETEFPVFEGGHSEFFFPNDTYDSFPLSGYGNRVEWCSPVGISALEGAAGIGCVGASCPAESDIVYKVDGVGNAYEAAWLSANSVSSVVLYYGANDVPVTTTSVAGLFEANGISFVVQPGEDYRFVWTGSAEMLDDVFYGHDGYPEFTPCAFSPQAMDYDYVYQDTLFPYDMDVSESRGYGFRYVGGRWEPGEMLEGAAAVPVLRRNCIYRYHRAYTAGAFREIHAYVGVLNPPSWKRMYRDMDGNWVGMDSDSDMVLRSGDRIVYDHISGVDVTVGITEETDDGPVSACKTFTEQHGPFAIRIPVEDARPYWADAMNSDGDDFAKPVDVYNSPLKVVNGVPLWVPQPAYVVVNPWDTVTYYPRNRVVWKKQIGFDTPSDEIRWKMLSAVYVDNPFEGSRDDNGQLQVVSAIQTDIDSDIVFSYVPGDIVLVNYVAQNAFTWTEDYSVVSVSGNFVSGYQLSPESKTVVVEAEYPHANMANRHYPSYAVVANVSEIFTEEDVGGYFVPAKLGVSVATSKGTTTSLDPWGRGPSGISLFSEGDVFAEDQGFTMEEQNVGLSVSSEDETWTRVGVYPVANAGMRNGNEWIQSFVPYLTEEENRGSEDKGVSRADDMAEPWLHDGGEDRWNPYFAAQGFVPHTTRQEPARRWAETRFAHSELSRVCSDMNGVQYALLKFGKHGSIYDERAGVGPVVYRAYDDGVHGICDLNDVLSGVNALRYGWVFDIDCARDMFVARCRTPDGSGLPSIVVPEFPVLMAESDVLVLDWYANKVRPSFARRFASLADRYGVAAFLDVVPDGFIENYPGTVMNGVMDDMEDLFDWILNVYIPVSLEGGTMEETVENTWLNERAIREAIGEFDRTTYFSSIYRSLFDLANALNSSLPFEGGVELVVSMPVSPATGDDGRYYVGTTVGGIDVRTLRGAMSSRGWYMNRGRKYIVPVLHDGGVVSPEFIVRNLDGFGVERRECNEGELSAMGELEKSISASVGDGAVRYRPVCSYNESTNTISVVRQVSGAWSEIGAFGVYTYNVVDDEIGGYAILPSATFDSFAEYIEAHAVEPPKDTPGESDVDLSSCLVSFYPTVEEYLSPSGVPTYTRYVLRGSFCNDIPTGFETNLSSVSRWINLNDISTTGDTRTYVEFRYDPIESDLSVAPEMKVRTYYVSYNQMNGSVPSYMTVSAGTQVPSAGMPDVGRNGYVWADMANGMEIPESGIYINRDYTLYAKKGT